MPTTRIDAEVFDYPSIGVEDSLANEHVFRREDRKANSKIPVSRFRQTVEKVQKDTEPRKTLIPIARTKIPPPSKAKAEEDFDRLFGNVVDTSEENKRLSISPLIEGISLNSDQVDSCFEEIIHSYEDIAQVCEDNEVKPLVVPLIENGIENSNEITENDQERVNVVHIDFKFDKHATNNVANLRIHDIVPLAVENNENNNVIKSLDNILDEYIDVFENGTQTNESTINNVDTDDIFTAVEEIVPTSTVSALTVLNTDISETEVDASHELLENNVVKAEDMSTEKNVDIVLKKPVSQRIALFEQPKDNKPTRIPRSLTKPSTRAKLDIPERTSIEPIQSPEHKDIIMETKPVIVDEVLKVHSILKTLKSMETDDTVEYKAEGNDTQLLIVDEIRVQYPSETLTREDIPTLYPESSQSIQAERITHNYKPVKLEENNDITIVNNKIKRPIETLQTGSSTYLESKQNGEPEIIGVTDKNETNASIRDYEIRMKIRRLKSETKSEMTRVRKKSLAEIEVGEKVKGKVGQMICRMNSIEHNRYHGKDLNRMEMPKKMTVMEKIALFERKTVFSKMDPKNDKVAKEEKTAVEIQDDKGENVEAKIEALMRIQTDFKPIDIMPTIELNNGQNMPAIAVGTVLMDPALIPHNIRAALDLGYRAIDTAFIYGNENLIGEAIKSKIDDGTVRREDLFIMSKLWSTFHKPDLVENACKRSLEALGLDYFDLFMIHNPMSFKEGGDVLPKIANVLQYSTYDYLDAWWAMEHLVDKGLVKGIGLSNFNSVQIAKILEKGRIKPVVNQVECHPYFNQHKLQAFCNEHDIVLSCYATLGTKDTPAAFKTAGLAVIEDPLIKVLAASIGKTPAQMLIRYQLEHNRGVVVKTSSAAHLWENLQAVTFKLSPDGVEALNALNKNRRYFTFKGMGDTHKNYPFNIQF